jgi:hypothetical protein
MRWYRSLFGSPEEDTLAALADDRWMLSPSRSVQDKASDTDRAIATFPTTAVLPMMRITYFDGFCGGPSSSLSGRRWRRTCGVAGRGGIADKSIAVRPCLLLTGGERWKRWPQARMRGGLSPDCASFLRNHGPAVPGIARVVLKQIPRLATPPTIPTSHRTNRKGRIGAQWLMLFSFGRPLPESSANKAHTALSLSLPPNKQELGNRGNARRREIQILGFQLRSLWNGCITN